MKKSIKLTLLFSVIGLLGVGCAATHIMDFTYVSTKVKQIDSQSGEKISSVESDRIMRGKDGLGLMETAVNNALAKAGPDAKYLKNASFYWKRGGVIVKGDAYK